MKNITVAISDEAYRQARVWAAERDVSLSRIVAYLLETLPTHTRAERRFSRPANPSPSPAPQTPVPSPPIPS